MIARLTVQRGTLTEYPIAEKVRGGWQNGVTFYPDGEVVDVQKLVVRPAEQGTDEPEWEYGVMTPWRTVREYARLEDAQRSADYLRDQIRSGQAIGDLRFNGTIRKRTKAKAGPWLPVEQEDGKP